MEIKGPSLPKIEQTNPELNKPLALKESSPLATSLDPKETISPKERPSSIIEASTTIEDKGETRNTLLERLNRVLFSFNKALKIEIDEDLKIPVYKIIDLQTKEVLKQIPLEDILKLKKALTEILKKEGISPEALKGLLLEKEA